MIGRAESAVLSQLETGTKVKAVKYGCGCTAEREKAVAIVIFEQRCPRHGQRLTGFWRK